MSTIQANKLVEDGTQAVQGLSVRWNQTDIFFQLLSSSAASQVYGSKAPSYFRNLYKRVARFKSSEIYLLFW